ncbi:MAG: dihydropteroate synthase [Gammaproteobacteria bacterium]|nr:dihydropteroate synthase [Gammaproteobacteria bacterium]
MIIVGIGTNIGNRLANLREAVQYLSQLNTISIQAYAPIYASQAWLDPNAPKEWDQPFLNTAILCNTTLSPLDLLDALKSIEQKMGRVSLGHWSPRIIDIDILAWGNQIIEHDRLQIPHRSLLDRPFALWPLTDLAPRWVHPRSGKTAAELVQAWGSRFTGQAPSQTHQIRQTLFGTKLVGVLNITPNSFSDGGLFNSTEKALEQVRQLVLQGAEIIDIGAEATSQHIWTTNSNEIPQDLEWQRLAPVLQGLPKACQNLPVIPLISIDTRNAKTARRCLEMGIDWINDVTGLDEPDMQQLTKEYPKAHWVMMHHLGVPPSPTQHLPFEEDPVALIKRWAEERLETLLARGASLDKIIFDPGIGFGKTAEQCVEILQRIQEFRSLGVSLLIGHSRKSFLSQFTHQPPQKRDELTLAISQNLMKKNVDYIRVHNVAAHGELLAWDSKNQEESSCYGVYA